MNCVESECLRKSPMSLPRLISITEAQSCEKTDIRLVKLAHIAGIHERKIDCAPARTAPI